MSLIKKYFTIWWIPIFSYLIPLIIYFFGILIKKIDVIYFGILIFYINVLGNIISSVVQIIIKKWYFVFPQLLISFLLFSYVSVLFIFSPPDYYGVNKAIPKNIKISRPIEREATNTDLKNNTFILSSIDQPGIYNYYTTYKPKELGVFFVKAYEITTNDRLSEKEITTRSKIVVKDLNESSFSGKFTIYEGSWGDKYGARIELWFKPNNTKKEYKILEKNYIVEGWMR